MSAHKGCPICDWLLAHPPVSWEDVAKLSIGERHAVSGMLMAERLRAIEEANQREEGHCVCLTCRVTRGEVIV